MRELFVVGNSFDGIICQSLFEPSKLSRNPFKLRVLFDFHANSSLFIQPRLQSEMVNKANRIDKSTQRQRQSVVFSQLKQSLDALCIYRNIYNGSA